MRGGGARLIVGPFGPRPTSVDDAGPLPMSCHECGLRAEVCKCGSAAAMSLDRRGRFDLGVDRVTDQRMLEAHAVSRAAQHAVGERRREQVEGLRGVACGQCSERLERYALTEHRGEVEQLAGGRREAGETGDHEAAQVRPVGQLLAARGVLGDETDEQRVAGRPLVQGVSQRIIDAADEGGQPRGDLRAGQARQPDRPDGVAAQQVGQHVAERSGRRIPIGRYEGEPLVVQLAGEVTQREHRQPVGPMQILEHDQQPVLARVGLHHVGDGLEQPEPGVRIRRVGDRERLRLGPAAQQPGPGPQRWCAGVIDRPSTRGRHASLTRHRQRGIGERALADAGRTADKHQAAAPGTRVIEGGTQQRLFVRAPG